MELVAVQQQRPVQILAVSPAMVAFAELLCLPLPDLAQAVEREVERNPALERVTDAPVDAIPIDRAAAIADEPTDAARLLADVRVALQERDHRLAELVVASLDERGFLTATVEELACWCGADPMRVRRILDVVRVTGPAGIAATDLRECLLLQLDRLQTVNALARSVIENHLEDIASGRFCHVARALGVRRDDVVAARDFVRERLRPAPDYSTNPRPAQRQTVDIVVDDQLRVSLTEPALLRLRVAPLYADLAEHGTALERRHARAHVRRANSFATRLEQRWETTRAVAQETIDRQPKFVRGDAEGLLPLTRAAVARALGVHESTVSRATRERHARLPDGRVVPMCSFFCAVAGGAREALRDLLANERDHPCTDAELADALADRGYAVARRTVAKYRAELRVLRRALR